MYQTLPRILNLVNQSLRFAQSHRHIGHGQGEHEREEQTRGRLHFDCRNFAVISDAFPPDRAWFFLHLPFHLQRLAFIQDPQPVRNSCFKHVSWYRTLQRWQTVRNTAQKSARCIRCIKAHRRNSRAKLYSSQESDSKPNTGYALPLQILDTQLKGLVNSNQPTQAINVKKSFQRCARPNSR